MTNILPIPTTQNHPVQQVLAVTDMKVSDLVKVKTATLKSLVGCATERDENKVPISVTK